VGELAQDRTHERPWGKPGLPRAQAMACLGWGLGRAAGEPGHTPVPPRDPASALLANAVANSHVLLHTEGNNSVHDM